MNKVAVARFDELEDRTPAYALIGEVDLVVVRYDDKVSVLYGRCLHRGALMADGYVQGDDLFCGVHQWDYRIDSGISAYNNEEVLQKFSSWIEDGKVWVDEDEISGWEKDNPLTFLAHLRKRLENANRAYTSVMVHCNGWDRDQVSATR